MDHWSADYTPLNRGAVYRTSPATSSSENGPKLLRLFKWFWLQTDRLATAADRDSHYKLARLRRRFGHSRYRYQRPATDRIQPINPRAAAISGAIDQSTSHGATNIP